jgi:hypothetical protein
MNNIYQLVLISCAILSLSSWPLIPLTTIMKSEKFRFSKRVLSQGFRIRDSVPVLLLYHWSLYVWNEFKCVLKTSGYVFWIRVSSTHPGTLVISGSDQVRFVWTKWYWDLSPSSSPVNIIPPCLFILFCGMSIRPVGGCSSETSSHPHRHEQAPLISTAEVAQVGGTVQGPQRLDNQAIAYVYLCYIYPYCVNLHPPLGYSNNLVQTTEQHPVQLTVPPDSCLSVVFILC